MQDKLRAEARSLLRSVAGESEAVFGRVCSFLAFFCFCLQHVGGLGMVFSDMQSERISYLFIEPSC